jgi:hypothetical protein
MPVTFSSPCSLEFLLLLLPLNLLFHRHFPLLFCDLRLNNLKDLAPSEVKLADSGKGFSRPGHEPVNGGAVDDRGVLFDILGEFLPSR